MISIKTSHGQLVSTAINLYVVGGAVRDKLLGKEPKDIDYVITGADTKFAQDMLDIGFSQVGNDFPVFLHPDTGDEYAFARKERKVGVGYNGFETITSPELTIEDDLIRRDLSINAMAIEVDTGRLIDPFEGQIDLQLKRLRHTSDAFVEDPLRVMRVARFAARYMFNVAPQTIKLMEQIAESGELKHLTPERVWVEFEKILSEEWSSVGIRLLRDTGALKEIVPSFEFISEDDLTQIQNIGLGNIITTKFAVMGKYLDKHELKNMKASSFAERLSLLYRELLPYLNNWSNTDAEMQLHCLIRAKVLQRDAPFLDELVNLSVADPWCRGYDANQFMACAVALRTINNAQLIEGVKDGKQIANIIKEAQLCKLREMKKIT